MAYAISAIAYWDWPEAWPDLFNILMEALRSGDANAVHGAMRVLTGSHLFLFFNLSAKEVMILEASVCQTT